MIVRLYKKHLDYFRRKSLHNPVEQFAFLLGSEYDGAIVEADRFYYPKFKSASSMSICEDYKEYEDAYKKAELFATRKNLDIVGFIHSHIDWPPIMSAPDFRTLKQDDYVVCGIVSCRQGKTEVMFWNEYSPLVCKLEYL